MFILLHISSFFLLTHTTTHTHTNTDDILFEIFRHVTVPGDLCRLARVCHRFRKVGVSKCVYIIECTHIIHMNTCTPHTRTHSHTHILTRWQKTTCCGPLAREAPAGQDCERCIPKVFAWTKISAHAHIYIHTRTHIIGKRPRLRKLHPHGRVLPVVFCGELLICIT